MCVIYVSLPIPTAVAWCVQLVQKFHLSYHHEDVEPVLVTVISPDRPVRIKFTPRDV